MEPPKLPTPPGFLAALEALGREADPPRPPDEAELAQMARHRRRHHGELSFALERNVYMGGQKIGPQTLAWNPANSTFLCRDCPGLIFWTGTTTPEMVRRAQLTDDALRPHLTGLYTREERDAMTRLYLEGDLNRETLSQVGGGRATKRRNQANRPEIAERRERVQQWMLERARVRGVFERVLDEAEAMQVNDPRAWMALAFCDFLARDTLRGYWKDIPRPERKAAREAGRKSRGRKLTGSTT